MSTLDLIFIVYVIVLAGLLFFPVSRLIWVLSVRRLERREERRLNADEQAGQRRRARLLALICVIIFSLLFNLATLGGPSGVAGG